MPTTAEVIAWLETVAKYNPFTRNFSPEWRSIATAAIDLIQTDQAAYAEGLSSALPLWRHAANEWADCATNGLQWLKNVKTQTSEIEAAIDAMAENVNYCRTVSIIAHDAAPTTPPPKLKLRPMSDAPRTPYGAFRNICFLGYYSTAKPPVICWGFELKTNWLDEAQNGDTDHLIGWLPLPEVKP